MTHRFKPDLRYSDVTPESFWLNRRQLMMGGAGLAAGSLISGPAQAARELPDYSMSGYTVERETNSFEDITTYNNFYEFGNRKGDPAKNAHRLTTEPWAIQVDGLCANPRTYDVDELIEMFSLEERIYRLRCVEAWSMVIPWIGFKLSELVEASQPESNAKYLAFETLVRPEEMVGQKYKLLDWPYREGLRMDEAMNTLSIMAVGLYGQVLPNQNGAPIRLVVPWKYGFKSIKSIVRISFTETMPPTTWNMQSPREYGFYSNVNPEVDHPRWSQAKERVIGSGLFADKIPTMMFNGYGEYVASMYEDMDLQSNY